MTDLPLPGFPADAACRSFYLGQIWQQVDKTAVADLVAAQGIDRASFWVYWDSRPPQTYGYHRGDCWVEFRTRQLAVLAWATLDGMPKWGRTLVVGPVVGERLLRRPWFWTTSDEYWQNKPGALDPSQNELIAVLQPQPAGSGPPPPQAPTQPLPRAPPPSVPPNQETSGHQDSWADLEETHPNAIEMLRSQSADQSPAEPIPDAANTSPAPGPEPRSSSPEQHDKDIWSDPTLLETIRRNATKVGFGWGGYFPFQADPFRRTIDPSEVLMLNWHTCSSPGPVRFCNEGGEVILEIPRLPREEERTEALWFLLAQASDEWSDEELLEMEKTLPLPSEVGM